MRRPIVLSFLLLFALPLLAQRHRAAAPPLPPGSPRISAEYAAGDLVYGPTYNANAVPRIAAGPDQSLVVWSGYGGAQAERIDASGHPIDLTPLTLAGLGQPAYSTDVVWDGSHYLAALTSYADDGWVVRLVGISTSGRVDSDLVLIKLKQQPVGFTMTRHASGELALAYVTRSYEVGAAIASPSGQVLREYSLDTEGVNQTVIRIAASPNGYLAAWDGGGALIGLHGGGATPLALPAGQYDVAWNGSDYLAVFAQWDGSSATNSIRAIRISATGEVSTPAVIHTTPSQIYFPAVVWNRGAYVILWKEGANPTLPNSTTLFDLHAARLSADLTVLEDRVLLAKTDSVSKWAGRIDAPAIAAQRTRNVFVWSAAEAQPTAGYDAARDLFTAVKDSGVLPSDSEVASAPRITRKALYENMFGLTAESGGARLFWSETPSFSWSDAQLWTASVDTSGRKSAARTLPIAPSGLIARSGAGVVAVARENSAPYRIMMTLADSSGAASSPVALVGTVDGTTASPLGLACGANECALVYSTIQGNLSDTTKYYLQRFTPAGALVGSAVDIPTGFSMISALGDQYLVVFKWPMQDHNLVVSRFADGKLSDVTTLLPQTFSYNGAVASNGREWLVVWSGTRDSRAVLTAFRVDAAGNVAGQTDITLEPGAYLTRLAATWDGRDWIVAWAKSGPQLLNDIQAARIAPDGTLLDAHESGDGFGVAATTNDEYTLAIDSAGDGLTAVGYARTTDDRVYGQTSRVFVRWIDNR